MNSTMKRAAALMMGTVMALGMTACGQKAGTESAAAGSSAQGTAASTQQAAGADGKTFRIGVLQLTQHPALDKANEGFVKALEDAGISCDIDQQNASNDQTACQTIAQSLAADNKDLILAIATPAAQAVAGATSDIPILVTAVTDPADAGLVESNEKPGTNVSGTSDLTPVKEQMELMKKLIPDVKTVGLIYSSAESNSILQVNMAKEVLDAEGIAYKDYTVSSSNEIADVVNSMVGNVDCIYTPTDNMVASAMATVSMVALENKIPVICGEEGMVDNGGLATYGIDYFQLGYKTGQQAVKILSGEEKVSEMPIEYLSADQCTLKINEDAARELGIDTSAVK